MSAEGRYVRVGAFVLGGFALAVAAVVVVAGGSLLDRPAVVETYFDESVQGLDVGSPVKLRGVKLGSVSAIGFVGDVYDVSGSADPVRDGNRVLVRMEITAVRDAVDRGQRQRLLEAMIERGLRVQLVPLGITGTYLVQADYLDPERHPPMAISWTPEVPYVPSAPSTITQISSAAERLMGRIDKLDVEGLLTHLDSLLVNVDRAVAEADVGTARQQTTDLLGDLRAAVADLREAIDAANPAAVSGGMQRTLEEARESIARLNRLLDQGSGDLTTALENLRVASENLRDATETARSYPSYLIFGAPPARAEEAKP